MMKEYEVTYFNGNADWAIVPEIDISVPYLTTPDNIKAWAQIAYNDDALLVHLKTNEENIRHEETGILGQPCHDSCLEFFFCPIEGDKRYFNIEFNINGCMYLGIGDCVKTLVRLAVEPDEFFKPEIKKLEKGWEIYYSVPYAFVKRFFPGFKAEKGTVIMANCYKCADEAEPANYLSWNPITSQKLSFHRPDDFGKMILK